MAVTDKTQVQLDLLSLKKVFADANKNPKSNQKDNRMVYTFSQGISSMTAQLESNNNLLTKMNKSISDLSHGMMMSTKGKDKDLTRKKDPNAKLIKEFDELQKLQMDELKYQKAKDKKSKMGLLGMFGLLLGAGGLLGFLMTGKTEFLHSLIKSFTKYSPLKFFLGFLDNGLKAIGAPLIKGVGTLFTKVFDKLIHIPGIAKGISKVKGVFKPITQVFTHIGEFIAKIGGIFGKGAAKEGVKAGGKAMGKSFLKKIPVIGAVLGLFFGIQRFKKGDVVGGILEIVSGLASVIPIAGTAIGIGLDAFLLLRDFTMKNKPPKEEKPKQPKKPAPAFLRKLPIIGPFMDVMDAFTWFKNGETKKGLKSFLTAGIGLFPMLTPFADKIATPLFEAAEWVGNKAGALVGSVMAAAPAIASQGIDAARKLPVIGTYIAIFDAMDKFGTDPLGAIKDIAATANLIVPGFGDTLIKGVDWIVSLKDWPPFKKFFGGAKAVASKIGAGAQAVGDYIASDTRDMPGDPMSSGAKKQIVNVASAASEIAQNIGSQVGNVAKDVAGLLGIRLNNKDIDLSGVHPAIWNNFTGMAAEYNKMTGGKGTLKINSAYRDMKKQAELYKTGKPGFVAPPGRSLHNYGLALDINSSEANQLASTGLLEKWGFNRPMQKEPWHIEPINVNRQTKEFGGMPTVDTPSQIGDPVNMPSVKLAPQVSGGTGSKGIDLSESTIALLAKEIGKQFASSRPTPRTPSFNVSTAGRG